VAAGIDVVAQAEDADVGLDDQAVGETGAGRGRGLEAHLLNQAGAVAVVDSRRHDGTGVAQQFAQAARLGLALTHADSLTVA